MNRARKLSFLLALVTAGALLAPAASAQTEKAGSPAQPPANETEDRGWPREFNIAKHTVRIYQPQLEDRPNFDRIMFHAAVSIAAKGSDDRTFGVLRASAATHVAVEDRLVVLRAPNKTIDL